MYLRRCGKSAGRSKTYWEPVESYRTERGPRQRVVAYLGDMGKPAREGFGIAVQDRGWRYQSQLFEDDLAPEWAEIDTRNVRIERSRDFGGAWLALRAMDLLGLPEDKVNDDRLYRALDRLLGRKADLEKHLKERLGSLFELEYDLLLYDVTSTFVEGAAAGDGQMQRGYSRDQRSDCKRVCIGLAVSRWATRCSTATAPTSRPSRTSWRSWKAVTAKPTASG